MIVKFNCAHIVHIMMIERDQQTFAHTTPQPCAWPILSDSAEISSDAMTDQEDDFDMIINLSPLSYTIDPPERTAHVPSEPILPPCIMLPISMHIHTASMSKTYRMHINRTHNECLLRPSKW